MIYYATYVIRIFHTLLQYFREINYTFQNKSADILVQKSREIIIRTCVYFFVTYLSYLPITSYAQYKTMIVLLFQESFDVWYFVSWQI